MIKLTRPSKIPTILLNKGKTQTQKDCNDFDNSKKDYTNGVKKFDFDSSIYGDSSVKNELKKAQHGKCAFCESKITHISYGDVEHFRPKGGFKNDEKDTLSNVGYYWLAYEWTNLLLSCQICNQRYKKNLFPLSNKKSRAKNHKEDISKEKLVFINPYEEDTRNHIGFNKELPFGKTKRGKITIESLGLDRKELNEQRLIKFKTLETINSLILVANNTGNSSLTEIIQAKDYLVSLTNSNSEYSAMIDDAIKANFT